MILSYFTRKAPPGQLSIQALFRFFRPVFAAPPSSQIGILRSLTRISKIATMDFTVARRTGAPRSYALTERMIPMDRSSGILLHISSLPSPYGIGTLGKAAYAFADFLHAAGQKYWQLLPLGPTSYGDSPYQSFSTFAGNPYFIDLDLLAEDGLLDRAELAAINWGTEPRYVDYGKIYESRFTILRKAFHKGFDRDRAAVEAFRKENPWLANYALYMAVKSISGIWRWKDLWLQGIFLYSV